MAPMTFISWIYHFLAQFWPYFNFVDFRAYFGHFSHGKNGKYKMPKKQQKMASNRKMQENKHSLQFNFACEYVWPVLILGIFCSDGPIQHTLQCLFNFINFYCAANWLIWLKVKNIEAYSVHILFNCQTLYH